MLASSTGSTITSGWAFLGSRSINPHGKADWEGVGVAPDVRVKAADALDTAMKLANAKVQQK